MRIRCFTIFRIHNYSIHFCIIPLLNSLYCYKRFSNFFCSIYKRHMISLISFRYFSDVLPAFTCVRAIGNLWSICLGVNILRLLWLETLSEKHVPLIFIGNILLSKALRTLYLPWKRLYVFKNIFSLYF